MGKLSIVGGFLSLVGVVGSIFLVFISWYQVSDTIWVNAIGGGGTGAGFEILSEPLDYIALIPGVIAIIGAILCFIPKKVTGIIGGILSIGGVAVFVVFFGLDFGWDALWVNMSTHVGWGAIGTFIGGLIGLIGGFVGND